MYDDRSAMPLRVPAPVVQVEAGIVRRDVGAGAALEPSRPTPSDCVPPTLIDRAVQASAGCLAISGEDCSAQQAGAFTGDVDADMLVDLLKKAMQYAPRDSAQFFDAAQNAPLVADAESYHRAKYFGTHESWNRRVRHMFNTLQNILAQPGSSGKAVVWVHDSHVGDARSTGMGRERGELNIGQSCRQAYERDASLIGLGTHKGTVIAATGWDGPMGMKTVRPSRPDSYEAMCHDVGFESFLLDLRAGRHDDRRRVLAKARLERYIGVIYRPETERWSQYSSSILADAYDAFTWFDTSNAVTPSPATVTAGEDETYPFGL